MSDEPPDLAQIARLHEGVTENAVLRAALDTVQDAVYVKDLNGRYVLMNAAALRAFGRSSEELIGRSDAAFFPFGDADRVRHTDRRIVESGILQTWEEELSLGGQTRSFITTKRPLLDADGQVVGVIGVSRDVTERKQVEQLQREGEERLRAELTAELARLAEEVRAKTAELAASRSAAELAEARAQEASRTRSEFLATMSHELRTPLNVITGYADLLQLAVHEETQRIAHLDRIKASAWHLLSIIEEILSFSRLEAGRETVVAEAFDAAELAQETVSMVRPIAQQKQLSLEVRLGEATLPLETDRAKLRQILVNLVSNALKFTDRGAIVVEGERRADRMVFRVRDTGCGIDPEHMEQIFEPFWQVDRGTRRKSGGTGLGLAVSRQLARLLGGNLTVESQPGVGSTFTVSIPITAPQ